MYNVSQSYLSLITSQKTQIEWSFFGTITTTDNVVYNFSLADLKQNQSTLTREICTSDFLEIGTTCSAELTLGIFLQESNGVYYLDGKTVDRYSFYDAVIDLTFRLFIGDSHEDVPCGIYTVSDATRTTNVLTLSAYDNMIKFSPSLSSPEDKTCYEWLLQACTSCGMELGNTQAQIEAMPNGTFITGGYEVSTKVSTWRDLIGHVASMLCGYAYIGRDGKLYIGNYGMTSVRTIGSGWRYTSQIADYETYYSSLSFYNARRNETQTVTVTGSGLTYEMSDNPLIQYPNKYAVERRMQEILDNLSEILYTPFEIKTPLDPALDIGDVIELTGNQAASGKYAAITTIVMPLNGQMSLKGVGQNPRLIKKSSVEKKIEEIVDTAYTGEARYDHYINTEAIAIADAQEQRVISLTYESATATHVDVHCEIKYNLTVVPYTDPDTSETVEEAVITAKYYQDGDLVAYRPVKTENLSGTHILSLMYFWVQKTNKKNGTFVVWLSVSGGTIDIDVGNSRGYICSQGWNPENSESYDDERVLIYIDVTSLPATTTYNLGETLDWTGVQIMAFYSDDTQEDITSSCTYNPASGTTATSGLTSVIVSYTKDGELYQCYFPVIIEGEYDDVYEVNGGEMIIATAATAMAKGDTVYFDVEEGTWNEITNDVSFVSESTSVQSKIAISPDETQIYSCANGSSGNLHVFDTTTSPWTETQHPLFTNRDISAVAQDGQYCMIVYYGTPTMFFVLDMTTGEVLNSYDMGNYASVPAGAIVKNFDNYICWNDLVINKTTSETTSFSYPGNNAAWISPTRVFSLGGSAYLQEYTFNFPNATRIREENISGLSWSGNSGYVIYTHNRLFMVSGDTIPQMAYVDDIDATPWTATLITMPTAFVASARLASLSPDGSKLIMSDNTNNVVGILDVDTLTWNVLGYITDDYYATALSGNLAICGLHVYNNTGTGMVAYKANNGLQGSKALGYATDDVELGGKIRFRKLFS